MTDSSDRYDVLVIGSANMDLVVSCERFPEPGETAFARSFAMYPGGKGANQAVAAGRLGGRVGFLGRMGSDGFRADLLKSLESNGVDPSLVLTDPENTTGVALITVDGTGQNEILVASGSNMALSPDDVEAQADVIASSRVVLLQLEIPVETVERAADLAESSGATVILNPAPACTLSDHLYRSIDFLTPNESEAALLTGVAVEDAESAARAGSWFLERGVRNVIFTLGEHGALLVNASGARAFPAPSVRAVDTTAAGDAFNGALACGLAQGDDIDDAVTLANFVAACSVTRHGAQPSMPSREELAVFSNQMRLETSP